MMFLLCLAVLIVPVKLESSPGFSWDKYETPSYCKKSAKCVTVSNLSFMGTPLTYNSTSLDLIPVEDQAMATEKLHLLQSLKYIPKCWAVVQPFLCSLYMPKCTNDTVELPLYERCVMVSTACRLVLNHTIWPHFIDCEDQSLFQKAESCKRVIHKKQQFNSTGKCLHPLIPTDNPLAVFEGVDGCGMPCNDPMYLQDEKNQTHSTVYWAYMICLILNFFTVTTFIIDWNSSNRYPALVIFWLNLCFMVCCIGWLSQFFTPVSRDLIVCRKDGTLRMNEPSGDSLLCVSVFIMIYFSVIAGMIWYVILTYVWYTKFKSYNIVQDNMDKNSAYFHIIAWISAFIMTVLAGAFGEIDGNYVTGVCFIGYNNHLHTAYFVLAPLTLAVLVGGYFKFRALLSLFKIKNSGPRSISNHDSAKVRNFIIRIGLFSFKLLFPIVIIFYCYWYNFQHSWKWKHIFRDYMICSITSTYAEMSECKMQNRPSAGKLQLHLLAVPIAGIIMSTWILRNRTVHSWQKFLKRLLNREEKPMKLPKHKVIAQAYARRKMINENDSCCSITFDNAHQDLVGMNFDLNNDVGGDYYSSSWAANLPKLVARRGAIYNEASETCSVRRNSIESQISVFNLRRVAVESRRSSCDSQFAMSFSELKAGFTAPRRVVKGGKKRKKATTRSRRRPQIEHRHRRNRVRDIDRSVVNKMRRPSTTSQDSHVSIQFALCQIAGLASNKMPLPNMGRRSGFDSGTAGNLENFAPFLLPQLGLERNDNYCSDENLSSEDKSNSENEKERKNENCKTFESEDDDESETGEHTKMIEDVETVRRSRSNRSSAR